MAGDSSSSKLVGIIGGGVIGLTTGIRLLEEAQRSHSQVDVRIVAEKFTPKTTSDIAAAFWLPSSYVHPPKSYARFAKEGYETLWKMSNQFDGEPWNGIRRVKIQQIYSTPGYGSALDQQHDEENSCKEDERHQELPFFHSFVKDFKLQSKHETVREGEESVPLFELKENEHGFTFTTLLIETPIAMKWLMARFTQLGGTFIQRKVASFYEATEALQHEHLTGDQRKVDLLINCSGLGAWILAHDTNVYPLRGQVIILHPPSSLRSSPLNIDSQGANRRDLILCHEGIDDEMTYTIPRQDGLLIGGTAIAHDWDLTPRESTTQAILQRCARFYPEVEGQPVVRSLVGLRPARVPMARVELEERKGQEGQRSKLPPVIHNYGHAGGGWSLSWGCAEEALRLAKKLNLFGSSPSSSSSSSPSSSSSATLKARL